MKYKCSICGKAYDDLGLYMKCVNKCGCNLEQRLKKEKELEEQKRREEINAALNRIKEAKNYYEQKLIEFKEKYPEEYKMNFGNTNCTLTQEAKQDTISKTTPKAECVEFAYSTDGNGTPQLVAKVNGKEVDEQELSQLIQDPSVRNIARLFGLLK